LKKNNEPPITDTIIIWIDEDTLIYVDLEELYEGGDEDE